MFRKSKKSINSSKTIILRLITVEITLLEEEEVGMEVDSIMVKTPEITYHLLKDVTLSLAVKSTCYFLQT